MSPDEINSDGVEGLQLATIKTPTSRKSIPEIIFFNLIFNNLSVFIYQLAVFYNVLMRR